MLKLKLAAFVLMVLLSINSYGDDVADAPQRYAHGAGPGERPSVAPIAEMRAKRASGRGDNAVMGDMSAMRGKPEGGARGGVRPRGMPMGMRGGAMWFSDTPPSRGDATRRTGFGGMGGMNGMEMGSGERTAVPKKRFWLRYGNDPQRSAFARGDAGAEVETLLATSHRNQASGAAPFADEGPKGLSFDVPKQGIYRLYHIRRKLQGDRLNVTVAKAEVIQIAGHGNTAEEESEEQVARALSAARYSETVPLEIVRERKPDEKRFFTLKSGEEQAFIVLQKGLPLQGARVRLVSYRGWVKEALSDEQGRVNFQIIRDYFPPWDDFQKRFKATYLVIAEADAAENGQFRGGAYSNVRYTSSLPGNYYPSPEDYLSYSWGLGIGLLITLFCGVAVYLYRRRRVKPFQEDRFDDKK